MDQINLQELLHKDEKLHPDLAPWVQVRPGFRFLNHPLVQETVINPDKCAVINKRYEMKKKLIDEALSRGNVHRYVFTHERPYRVDAFNDYLRAAPLDDRSYWEMMQAIWIDSENVWQHKKMWRELWRANRTGLQQYIMNADERKEFYRLPPIVKVYRGINRDKHDRRGLSWTLDPAKAEWFALRYKGVGLVLEGMVKKKHVYALLFGRDEREIICRQVEVTSTRKAVKHVGESK